MSIYKKIERYEKTILQAVENKVNSLRCMYCLGNVNFDTDTFKCRCTSRLCRKRFSLFSRHCMQGNVKQMVETLLICDCWVNGGRIGSIAGLFDQSRFEIVRCIKDYNVISENLIANYFDQIGGKNVIVEIDESKFGKRKYNRGHRVVGSWVVGLVERTDQRRIILVPVLLRDKVTLHALIKKHVKKGSIVITDEWKGYHGLSNIGYDHYTIKHKEEYSKHVNNIHVHTNTIEGNWRSIKDLCPSRYRTNELIMPYLNLYIIKRFFDNQIIEVMIDNLLI